MTHFGERRTVFFGQVAGRRKARRGRNILVAVGKIGYPGAEVARVLGVRTSAVIRAAYSEELPELQKYL